MMLVCEVNSNRDLLPFTAEVPLSSTTVPLLMPLLTLLERPTVSFEGMELWESNDQGCEIMLRHLEEARAVARNADTYTYNAKRVLQGNSIDKGNITIIGKGSVHYFKKSQHMTECQQLLLLNNS